MWAAPEPGDIVWCRLPERSRDKPGPKPRPALVLDVTQRDDGIELTVAYGTSRKLDRLAAGEFAIRQGDHPAAFELAGLSFDTTFDPRHTIALPWSGEFFDVPPMPRHGQKPKLGTLHATMVRAVEAALRAARPRL